MTPQDDMGGDAPKQMFQGSWPCSGCSATITELPFEPSPDREGGLMCKDCFRNSRGPQ